MTDEVTPKKRGRKPSEKTLEDTIPLPLEDSTGSDDTKVIDDEQSLSPEDVLRPILERSRASVTKPTMVPTMTQYTGSTTPREVWMLVPVDSDTLEVAWRAYKTRFGTSDKDTFIRVVHNILGVAMDSTIRHVHFLRLE